MSVDSYCNRLHLWKPAKSQGELPQNDSAESDSFCHKNRQNQCGDTIKQKYIPFSLDLRFQGHNSPIYTNNNVLLQVGPFRKYEGDFEFIIG